MVWNCSGGATMSEFKFACPVCGQHITCDSANSGSQMECPTCFRKLVVPQSPSSELSKFILSAVQVSDKKPIREIEPSPEIAPPPSRWRAIAWTGGFVLALAGAAFAAVKWGGLRWPVRKADVTITNAVTQPTPPPRVKADPRWRLELNGVPIPTNAASGRILGREFHLERATIQNGTLALRQGSTWPPDVGVTIVLPPRPARDFAGKQFLITKDYAGKAPRVVLRIMNDEEQEVTKTITRGYAMKLEFDQLADERLPGRVYLCTPDAAKSVVVGSFRAEVRKPNPPKRPAKAAPQNPTNAPPVRL